MDGLSLVQSRISEITTRMATLQPRSTAASTTSAPGAGWSSAAAAAGLDGTTAVPGPAAGTDGSGSAVVAAASKYLGVPYAWGGTDPATGLDCSGLTQRVYADLGVSLPRTSSQQATAGRAVASLAQAQPGDLVFFDNSSGRPGVDHVGIYVGNGKMIAAPTEGQKVSVQDVGKPTIIRRVLPDSTTAVAAGSASGGGSGSGLAGVPYADLFTQAGAKYGISPALLAGVAKTESSFNSSAVSPVGARGLMQFMPATAAGLGVDTSDPASSIDGAARYLSSLVGQFGSTDLALAAYNAGPATVQRTGGIPAAAQSYVQKVTSAAEAYS